MKKNLVLVIFLILSLFSKADHYPINYSIQVLHYKFELSLSDNTNEIAGKATIILFIKNENLKELLIDLIQKTEDKTGMGMVVDSVKVLDKAVKYIHLNNRIQIHFPQAPRSGTELSLQIIYHGIPKEGLLIGKNQFGKRCFFSDNWPNKARNWLPTFDHPYYKATSEFIVTAPLHYKVISNGLLLEESTLDSTTKITHWKQSVPVSNWLFDLGVADFAVQYYDFFQGKSLQTWVFPENREEGFYDFSEVTKKSVEFFSQYIGPYVYEKIANIQTSSVAGGMESSSAIFYAQKLVNGKRTERLRNVVIHELAHQWFGNSVTEKSWDDVWLSEGFATFFTLLFIEKEYGEEEYKKGLMKAKEMVYQTAIRQPGFKIIDQRDPEKEEVTSTLTYQKGAWMLHMLRKLMGEESFHKGIRSYYALYINHHASTQDFRQEMEKASGKKLGSFFDQWLLHSENPELKGSWKYDSRSQTLHFHLEQIQPGDYVFNLPIEMAVYKDEKKDPIYLNMNLASKILDYTIPFLNQPQKIEFDPNYKVLSQFHWVN